MTRCARKKQQNWQELKKKLVQAAASLYFLNIRNNPPLHAFCGQWVAHQQQHTGSCAWDWGRAIETAARSWAEGRGTLGSGDEVMRCLVFYSSFFCSFFWKQTGKMESTASTPSTAREFQDTASPAVVSLYSVVPALIATKDGGATPVNEPGWIQVSQWTTNDTKN